jgi:hypothetical protein
VEKRVGKERRRGAIPIYFLKGGALVFALYGSLSGIITSTYPDVKFDQSKFVKSMFCLFIWLFGYLVIWLFGYLVIWLFGYLVIWLFGYLFGYLVIWLFGYLVIWLFGYLVIGYLFMVYFWNFIAGN